MTYPNSGGFYRKSLLNQTLLMSLQKQEIDKFWSIQEKKLDF